MPVKTKGKIVTGKEALDKHEKVFGGYYLSKDEIEWILMKLRGLKYPPEEFNIFTKVFAKLAEAYDKKWYLFKSFIGPVRGSGLIE